MLTYIGQFFDHDIDLTVGANPPEPAHIEIPLGDSDFDPEGISEGANTLHMTFFRSRSILIDGVPPTDTDCDQWINI